MNRVTIAIKVLPHGEGLGLPAYATAQSAGCDLVAALAEPLTLPPGARQLVPTGLSMAIPDGFEGQVRSRSGLGGQQGLVVAHGVGTIDADYRGELFVPLLNNGQTPRIIERGMRIAQCVIAPVVQAAWAPVSELPETARGTGGFGSSGVTQGA